MQENTRNNSLADLNVYRSRRQQEGRNNLLLAMSTQRRAQTDVLWLKENAELLSVLTCTAGTVQAGSPVTIAPAALDGYLAFYENSPRYLAFFRQYYRFVLSICMDLEDLGRKHGLEFAGGASRSEALARWVAASGIVEGELSDLQRAEAARLLARRGVFLDGAEQLRERLLRFARRSETFALPNRKAAYELTHIVFYLSEYGQQDPQADACLLRSLHFAGTIAYLDQDADLLAEICIALLFCRAEVPKLWADWLSSVQREFGIELLPPEAQGQIGEDDMHTYMMCGWFYSLIGRESFFESHSTGPLLVTRGREAGALRGVSVMLYMLQGEEAARGPAPQMSWGMQPGRRSSVPAAGGVAGKLPGLDRAALMQGLDVREARIFERAAQGSPQFGAFFEIFSRRGAGGALA